MAASFRNVWDQIMKRKFLRHGIPFIIFMAGGSFYLKQFASLRYEFRKGKKLSPEEAEAMGIKVGDVEEEGQKMLKEIEEKDLDNWQNVRGPRPWEDSKSIQLQNKQQLAVR